jgi:hypothetical protein
MAEEAEQAPPGVDPKTPSAARIYDYMLGGTNNFQADRDALGKAVLSGSELRDIAWANRGFHQRSARWIAERGIRQFIDLGAGLPTVGNTHEVVRQVIGDARVAYVDIDPMVAAHADALLAGDGGTKMITADLRDPDAVLADPVLRELIDFSEPVGLVMTAVLHFVADDRDPWGLVDRYVGELAPGSYLALSHATADNMPPMAVESASWVHSYGFFMRTKTQVARFFDGLELVAPYAGADPDVVYVGLWGCEDPELADSDGSRWSYSGVARRS